MSKKNLRKSKSCGILLFNEKGNKFLLMKHPTRWDIPKGHDEKGETDLDTAYREFEEETGISRKKIQLIDGYQFKLKYETYEKRYNEICSKTLLVFLAQMTEEAKIKVTEHDDFKWFKWQPPHDIQEKTINPLLRYTADFFAEQGLKPMKRISVNNVSIAMKEGL
jgi:8-oxo-dGTP pyrophosphatase MutT (NUDIX family)